MAHDVDHAVYRCYLIIMSRFHCTNCMVLLMVLSVESKINTRQCGTLMDLPESGLYHRAVCIITGLVVAFLVCLLVVSVTFIESVI